VQALLKIAYIFPHKLKFSSDLIDKLIILKAVLFFITHGSEDNIIPILCGNLEREVFRCEYACLSLGM